MKSKHESVQQPASKENYSNKSSYWMFSPQEKPNPLQFDLELSFDEELSLECDETAASVQYEMRVRKSSVVFLLTGDPEGIKKHVRELVFHHLHGQQCSLGDTENPSQYLLYLDNNNAYAIEETFFYLGKVTATYLDPNALLRRYSKTAVYCHDLAEEGRPEVKKLGMILAKAADNAYKRASEPLEYRFDSLTSLRNNPKIPKSLWLKKEIEDERFFHASRGAVGSHEKIKGHQHGLFSTLPNHLSEGFGLGENKTKGSFANK